MMIVGDSYGCCYCCYCCCSCGMKSCVVGFVDGYDGVGYYVSNDDGYCCDEIVVVVVVDDGMVAAVVVVLCLYLMIQLPLELR